MTLERKVFNALKPKTTAFGFNRKELLSVAAEIANNLQLKDDASEEDIASAIDDAIDLAIPYLKLSQSMATRVINDSKKPKDGDDQNDDDDNDDDDTVKASKKSSQTPPEPQDFKESEAFKALMSVVTDLKSEITSLKGEKVSNVRKSKLEELLKDSGAYGKTILKSFDKMTFKDDAEFDEYFDGIEEEYEKFAQEMADSGLSHLPTPPALKNKQLEKKTEVFTEEEITKLADSF